MMSVHKTARLGAPEVVRMTAVIGLSALYTSVLANLRLRLSLT